MNLNCVNRLGILIGSIALFASSSAHAHYFYPLENSFNGSAINNTGQIVGSLPGSPGYPHAGLWNNGVQTDLHRGDGFRLSSNAVAINNAGQIALNLYLIAQDNRQLNRAAVWSNGAASELAIPGGKSEYDAYAINDAGQLVGRAYYYDYNYNSNLIRPILWSENGTIANELATLGGNNGSAYGINNSGKIVGSSALPGNSVTHATLWQNGAATDLGALGGVYSNAYSINDAGQIIGASQTGVGNYQHAVLWNGTTMIDLGTLTGGVDSVARAVNSWGQIVGASDAGNGSLHATLWDGTTLIDLNSFLDANTVTAGWVLTDALDINDSGAIVGWAFNTHAEYFRSFLLSPVPLSPVSEPGAYAMFLAGLSLLGFMRRHRKTS